jgi:hypothetical protein
MPVIEPPVEPAAPADFEVTEASPDTAVVAGTAAADEARVVEVVTAAPVVQFPDEPEAAPPADPAKGVQPRVQVVTAAPIIEFPDD